jgi:hypothetical protein
LVPIDAASAVDREKNMNFFPNSFRAELRAENGFFGTHRGDQALFKNFLSYFFLKSVQEWVIAVGEAEYRKKFRG